jgi:hypothetical protein
VPQIEAGRLKIYYERLDSILINTVHPRCFLCGEFLLVSDGKALVIKGSDTIRLSPECFASLISGLGIFIQTENSMGVFTNEIQ